MVPERAGCSSRHLDLLFGTNQGGPNLRWYKLRQQDAVVQAGPVVPPAVVHLDRTGNPATGAPVGVPAMGARLVRGRPEKTTPAGSKNGWFSLAALPRW